jgi:tight adherence protein C
MPIFAVTLLVFIGTALVLFLLMYMFVPGKTILEERIEGLAQEVEPEYREHPPSGFEKFLANLGGRVPLNPRDYSKYMKSLVAAGFRGEMIPVFMGAKLLLMTALPAVYVFSYGIRVGQELIVLIFAAVALAIVGFLIPSYWLSWMVRRRQLKIFHDLPDVLDLLTVCVEAGLSMDAAIVRIAGDRQFRGSPLARELRLATQEARAGKPREDALRDLGERTMLDDMKSFVAMLIQTERLGTSLADSLRVHSDSLRTIRRQKAEEAAAKTSVKLLFPLVFLIMPALFVVMLMPAILRMIKIFSEL